MKNDVKERRELIWKKDGAKVWRYENVTLKTEFEYALEQMKNENDFVEMIH
jgi:hypothetical protein